MARIIPVKIPADILANPQRSAECKTFRRLESELEDPFVVFYSRPWHGMNQSGEEIDGECDFVVAHPELGILAIEVKGGQISYDPLNRKWISRDRYGYDHDLKKGPFDQAKTSKYHILEKLKKSKLWSSRRIQATHGVIFPDTADPGEDLGADMPEEMICYLDIFDRHFRDWILSRFHDLNEYGSRLYPLGDDGMNALEDLLARPFQLHVPMGHILAEDDQALEYLTQQQYYILKVIDKVTRASIAGGAGTGKTVLAMEEAIRNAEAGRKVLLTCYNRPLAEWMKRRAGTSDNLLVMNFHEFCRKMMKDAGIGQQFGPQEQIYRELYPAACIQALMKIPEYRFDTIIIDEGQDFLPLWLTALNTALTEKNGGKIRVYYDSNQRLYGNTEKILGDYHLITIPLSINIRNTQNIHETAQHYYSGDPIDSYGPKGSAIEYIPAGSPSNMRRELENLVSHLIKDERVGPGDIAVLAESKHIISEMIPTGKLAGIQGITCEIPEEDKIIVDTIRRFKGLESPVVILIITPEVVLNEELLYVAISRARTHLFMIGEKSSLERIKNVGQVRK
jgi:hypothetical protein